MSIAQPVLDFSVELVNDTLFDVLQRGNFSAMHIDWEAAKQQVDLAAIFNGLNPVLKIIFYKHVIEGKNAMEISQEIGLGYTVVLDYSGTLVSAIFSLLANNGDRSYLDEFLTRAEKLYRQLRHQAAVSRFWDDLANMGGEYVVIAHIIRAYYTQAIQKRGFFKGADLPLTDNQYRILYLQLVDEIDLTNPSKDHILAIQVLKYYADKALKIGDQPRLHNIIVASYSRIENFAPQFLAEYSIEAASEPDES